MSEQQAAHKMLEIKDYYHQLHKSCGLIISKSFEVDQKGLHSSNHNYIGDLEKWLKVLEQRPESSMFKAALREYQYALLAVVQGQYRQAFTALRLFVELALGAIHFSANELELRIWLKNQRDIKWTTLIDEENGVYSRKFVSAFYEDLADESAQYGAIAKQVYRECSEYVHGNAHTHQTIHEKLEFVETEYSSWQSKASNARLAVSFALCARYLLTLNQQDRGILELAILDELGHVPTLRALFGGTVEE